MWVTTLEEIARHAAQVTAEVRTHTRYDVPAFPDAPSCATACRCAADV